MEPQLEGCGKVRGLFPPEWDMVLQWSRNLRVAESGKKSGKGMFNP